MGLKPLGAGGVLFGVQAPVGRILRGMRVHMMLFDNMGNILIKRMGSCRCREYF